MVTDIQSVILQQLAEIQRSLGETVGAVEALREEVKSQGADSHLYRDDVAGQLSNAVSRVGQLEHEMKSIRVTIEKTLIPMSRANQNNKQRIIGFLAAWSIFGTFVGFSTWLLFGGGLKAFVAALLQVTQS